MSIEEHRKYRHTAALLGLTAAIFAVGHGTNPSPRGRYRVCVAILALIVTVGPSVAGMFRGAWIDKRKLIISTSFS